MNELRKIQAKTKITAALGMRNGPIPITSLSLGSLVFVLRKNRGWEGPFTLLNTSGRDYTVEVKGRPITFRSTSVRKYFKETAAEATTVETTATNEIKDKATEQALDSEQETPEEATTDTDREANQGLYPSKDKPNPKAENHL